MVELLPELLLELVLATETKLSARDERLVFRFGRGGGICFLVVVVVAVGEVGVAALLGGRGGGCRGGSGMDPLQPT